MHDQYRPPYEISPQVLTTSQIIVSAMIMAVLMLAGVAILLSSDLLGNEVELAHEELQDSGPLPFLLRVVWTGMFVGSVVFWHVFSSAMSVRAQKLAEQPDTDSRIDQLFLIRTLAVTSAFEASGLLGGVLILMSGQFFDLALPLVSVAAIAMVFPTRPSARRFAGHEAHILDPQPPGDGPGESA